MSYELYILALMIAAAIAAGLALVAWRRRPTPGSAELSLLLLAIALWSLATGLEAGADERALKLFFGTISYIGSQSTPVLVFLFALRYTQRDGWLTPGRIALLFVIPALSVLMAATNQWHHLLWSDVVLIQVGQEVAGVFVHGPWFSVVLAYSYALLGISIIVISAGILRAPRVYVNQTFVLLAAALVPWLANAAYAVRPTLIPGVDPTPIAFTISGLLLLWAFARYHFLTVLPIARDRLIEEMDDAILVLDSEGCVIDFNPAGHQLLGSPEKPLIGQSWSAILAEWTGRATGPDNGNPPVSGEYALLVAAPSSMPTELAIGQGSERRIFDIRVTPLHGSRRPQAAQGPRARPDLLLGELVLIRDITGRRLAEEAQHASETIYRTVIETSPDAITLTDRTGRFIVCNRTAWRLHGFTGAHDMLGTHALELFAPEERQRATDAIQTTLAHGTVHRGEYNLLRKDGSSFVAELSASAIPDAAGQPQALVGVVRDITARKATEREAQRRLSETLLLNRVIAAAASALEPNAVLTVICRELAHAFDLQQAACALLAGTGDHLTVVAEYCAAGRPSAMGAVIPLAGNLATQHVFEQRVSLVVSNAQTDERQAVIHDLERRRGTVSLLIVPLQIRDRVIGTLGLDALEHREFTPDEIALTESVAAAASSVLENAQLFAAAQQELAERKRAEEKLARHARELEALHDTALEITAQLDLTALLHAIVRRAANLLDAPMGGLYLVRPDGETLELVVSHKLPGDFVGTILRLGEGLSGRVAQTGRYLMVSDYRHWDGRAAVYADGPFSRVLGVPLKMGEQVIGVLDITDDRHAGEFSAEEVRLASRLADQAAIAVQNARLYGAAQSELSERRRAEEALRRTNKRLQGMQAIDRALMQARTNEEPVDVAALRYMIELVPCAELDIATFDFVTGKAVIAARIAHGVVEARPGYTFPLESLPLARIQEERVFLGQIGETERELPGYGELDAQGIRSFLVVALTASDRVFGLFALFAETEDFFTPEYVEIAEEVAGQIALSLHQDRLNEQIRHHAQELEVRVAERTAEIQQLSSLQRTIVEHADLGIISTTPAGIVQTFNPAAERMLGYSAAEIVASSTPEIWHDAAEMAERAAEFSTELGVTVTPGFEVFVARSLHGLSNTFEWTYVRKDGSRFPVLLTVSTLRADDGGVRGFVGVATDITESKEVEKALTRYAQEVEDLYNHAPCGYHSLDATGQIIRINDTELNWLGYERPEVIGRRFVDFIAVDARQQVEKSLVPCSDREFVRDLEFDIVRRDGTLLPVLLSTTVVYAADGAFLESRSTMFDIRELRAADLKLRASEAAMRQANRELAHAVRLKDEFLANMSHELRTPLNAILSLTESLEEGIYGPVNEKQGEAMHYISESGQHLLGLINDILDLTKVEAGKLELQMAPVDVDTLCQASLRLVKQQAHEKHLIIHYSGGAEIGPVITDERRLKQIIVNLLSNAVKFTPDGGAVGLQVEGDPVSQSLRFVVWDTGIGIPAAQLGQLFRPFVQLDSRLARHYSGTGLGLALVRRLTDLFGGSVEVESEEGQGSRFAVRLPWQRSDEGTAPSRPQAMPRARRPDVAESPLATGGVNQSAEDARLNDGPRVILVAEDHQVNMMSYRDYLTAHGYEVVEAWDGVEAVKCAERCQPDLILMDIQMPNMDGLDAIRAIRALPTLAATPIIAVTALAMRGDRERCLAAGANEYVSKPIDLRALVQSIRALVPATQ